MSGVPNLLGPSVDFQEEPFGKAVTSFGSPSCSLVCFLISFREKGFWLEILGQLPMKSLVTSWEALGLPGVLGLKDELVVSI